MSDPVLDLPWRERRVLSMRSNGLTLAAIGERMNISRERVRQLESKALERLGNRHGTVADVLQRSPYLRFKKAIATGALDEVRRTAVQVAPVDLIDALGICLVLRAAEPHHYGAAVERWLTRFSEERPAVNDDALAGAREALLSLDADGKIALQAICAAHGMQRARFVLFDDDRRAW